MPHKSQHKSQGEKKQAVALSSVLASAVLTIIKLTVGLLTGSMGIISEAAHSALDLGAATLTWFAVRVGDKPADDTHQYGHAKIESVSALIETGLLFLTSAWIIYESSHRLLNGGAEVEATWYAFAVMALSIIIDFSRSRALNKVARQTNSQALEADALHFSSDILSSIVVLAGLGLVALGIQSADAYAAIGVSIFVFYAGIKLGKRTIDTLVDAAPKGIREKVLEITSKTEGVTGIEKVLVRQLGSTAFIDLTVYVSRKLALVKAQAIADQAIRNIHAAVPETDISVRTKPLPLNNETLAERVQIAAARHNLQAHDIAIHTQKDKKYLSYDLEVEADLKLKQAHDLATRVEGEIRNEIGSDIEINTHIEPLRPEIVPGQSVSLEEENRITKIVMETAGKIPLIEGVHGIRVRKTQNRLFLSFHCLFSGSTLLETAHGTASRLEYLIKEELPEIRRIVIHTEPSGK